MCTESKQNAREQMSDNTIVSGDGRYPIRRNAHSTLYDKVSNLMESEKIIEPA